MELSYSNNDESPVGGAVYGAVFTAILSMAIAVVMLIFVIATFKLQAESAGFWARWHLRVELSHGYAALALFAGGVGLLVRMRQAAMWLVVHGLLLFALQGSVMLANMLVLVSNVRELNMPLAFIAGLNAAVAGIGFFIARNAWDLRKNGAERASLGTK